VVVDHGSYNITTYIEKKRRKEKRKKRRRKEREKKREEKYR